MKARIAWLLSAALSIPVPAAEQDLRAFPPPSPVVSPIRGAIDSHVHSAPDVFGRSLTDIETATAAKRAGMRGIVLENAVIHRGAELGVRNRVVTHAMAEVPNLSAQQMKEVARLGGYLELDYVNQLMGPEAHLPWMQGWQRVSFHEMALAIKDIGAEHFILATDLDQVGNPIHPDGYTLLVQGLKQEGISDGELDRVMRRNPARLLGLEP